MCKYELVISIVWNNKENYRSMIFNSFNFIIIFPLIFLLYYVIPARFGRGRNLFLLLVSYGLYLQWKPIYALILLGVTFLTYYTAKLITVSKRPKVILAVGILLALTPLFFFKYFYFINETITQFISYLGINVQLQGLNWAIPIGLSFFTFQAIGYVCDIYLKKQELERDFLTYALFVSFFPCIISGPINKASLVIPQIKAIRPYFDYEKAVKGLKLLLWGMFMKVVVADRLALYVNIVFDNYVQYSGMSCLMASIFYTVQIYTDFAGYSLMAIGVGKVLGFDFTQNFNRPYFAVSVTDFWHRWHMSLSQWLRDYIYIPLGGSRCSKIKNYWNIFVTFLVSGIWHGANWTFIVWGCIHGAVQIIEKILGLQRCQNHGLLRLMRILLTFTVVNFAWIFFRMPTLADSCSIIKHIFDFSQPMQIYIPVRFEFYVVGILVLLVKDITDEFCPHNLLVFNNRNKWIRWTGYVMTICYILIAGVFGADQFIYANF